MCFMKHTNKPAPSPAPDYYYHVHHGSMFHVKNGDIHSHLVCTLKLNCGILHAFTKQKLVQASWKNWQRESWVSGSSSIPFYYEKNAKFYIKTSSLIFLRTAMITDRGLEPFLRPAQLWTRPLLMRGNYNVHILGSCWGVVYGLLGICCRRGAFHNPKKKNPKP